MTAASRTAFARAWENFNAAAPRGARLTRPQFASLVLKAPELFKTYVLDAAKEYVR